MSALFFPQVVMAQLKNYKIYPNKDIKKKINTTP